MGAWYDNINPNEEQTAKPVDSFSTNEMEKLGKLMHRAKYHNFNGSLSGAMLRYGMIGAAAGLLGGLLAKKNIMLLTLAGTGIGSIAGYIIDTRISLKSEKETKENTNTNSNDTEDIQNG